MQLNDKQKKILTVLASLLVLSFLFPPFYVKFQNGVEVNLGYGFLLDPPKRGAFSGLINISTLAMEWLLICVLGGVFLFLATGKSEVGKDKSEEGPIAEPVKNVSGIGGWLLVLCVILTIISPLKTLGGAVTNFEIMKAQMGVSSTADVLILVETALMLAISAFSIFVGYALWTLRPNAVKSAKTYFYILLAVPLVFGIIDRLYLMELDIEPIGLAEDVAKQFFGALAAFGIWFSYLCKSKRVKNTYPDA